MGKSGKKDKKKRIGYNHLGLMGVTLVVLALLGVLMMQSRNLENTVAIYNARAAGLEEEIESEKERTKEIDAQREYMLTDEYAQQAAREKLGLVKENEIIFEEKN